MNANHAETTTTEHLTPGQAYVAELELEHARATPEARADQPWWGLPLSIAGAATGFGFLLVVLGAVVMGLRLLADDLPIDQALSSISYGSLAVIGAHTLVAPVIGGILMLGLQAWLDFRLREAVRAADRGEDVPSAPLHRTQRAWGIVTWALYRAFTWVYMRRRLRLLFAPFVLPVWKLSALLDRYRLNLLYYVMWFPLIPSWTATIVCYTLAWRYSRHVFETAHISQRSRFGLRARVLGGFAVAAIAVALVGQFDRQQLPPATVTLTNGAQVKGLYVGTDANSVTLGVGHHLRVIPRAKIEITTLRATPERRHGALSPAWMLGKAVGSIF